MREMVDMTSEGFDALARCVNIAAKASSVTIRGRLCVTEIGLWREKNEDRARAARHGLAWCTGYNDW